jgi:chromosome segregation ATPase
MTSNKDKDTPEDRVADVVAGPIHDHLRMTEEIIQVLRKEVSHYRKQNDALITERNQLLKSLTQLQAIHGVRDDLVKDLSLTRDDRDRLAATIRTLREENQELDLRCSRIEADLAEERHKHAQARELIVCLEEQISQLEAIANMLRGHEEFVQGMD